MIFMSLTGGTLSLYYIGCVGQKEPDWGPTLVRLAWHSSGTYDKIKKNGGSGGGTIRFKEELAHGGNAGLSDTAVKWLEPIHAKYEADGLSYADLYTLAGGKSLVFGNSVLVSTFGID